MCSMRLSTLRLILATAATLYDKYFLAIRRDIRIVSTAASTIVIILYGGLRIVDKFWPELGGRTVDIWIEVLAWLKSIALLM